MASNQSLQTYTSSLNDVNLKTLLGWGSDVSLSGCCSDPALPHLPTQNYLIFQLNYSNEVEVCQSADTHVKCPTNLGHMVADDKNIRRA